MKLSHRDVHFITKPQLLRFHEDIPIAKDQNTYAKRKREADKRAKAEEKLARKKQRKLTTDNVSPSDGHSTELPDNET